LEIGASPASVRGVTLEDSWKGEILPGFLFLGDRVTASDMDRLTTLEVRHTLEGPPPTTWPTASTLALALSLSLRLRLSLSLSLSLGLSLGLSLSLALSR
jgi:hypothetical protein